MTDDSSNDRPLPAARARRVDEICDRCEGAWRLAATAGSRPRLEDYLSDAAPDDRPALLQELLALELAYRRRAGDDPLPGPYLERFPDAAEHVGRAFRKADRLPAEPSGTAGPTKNLPRAIGAFGDYELLDRLGRGGMGIVYKARQRGISRVVALKVISPERLDGLSPSKRRRWLERFRREIEAAARLEHEHVVPVYEFGEVDSQPFYSMRYIEGRTLSERARAGPLPGAWAAACLETVARAVHHAHERGVLHRDLKPRNILLDVQERPFVSDFGLAKCLDSAGDITETGDWLGTPAYVAPEQAEDPARAAPASDVYSLGATLYELLTGRPPFQGATSVETLHQVLHAEPVPPRRLNPAIARDLETICLTCLEKDPRRRYDTALSLANDLRHFRNGETIRTRPAGAWERAAKWVRRRPLVSVLLAGLLLVTAAGGAATVHQWREAARAREQAEENLYFSRIAQVELEWRGNNLGRAEQLLDAYLPHHGQPDRRGWEWHYLKRLCHADLQTFSEHGQWVLGVAFSPDGLLLASAAGDRVGSDSPGELCVRDVATGASRFVVTNQPYPSQVVAFSPDRRLLACGGSGPNVQPYPGRVTLYETATGRSLVTLQHGGSLGSLAFSPGDELLAVGSETYPDATLPELQGDLRLWDPATGRAVCSLRRPGAPNSISGLAFSPDGRILAAQDGGEAVVLWDVRAARVARVLPLRSVCTLAWSPDGKYLAAAGEHDTVRLWDAKADKEVQVLRGHAGRVWSVAFSHDGRSIATASADTTVRLWDPISGVEQRTFRGHTWGVRSVAFAADGRLASGGQDKLVKVWDATRSQQSLTLQGESERFSKALGFSADGRRLVAIAEGGGLSTWDAVTGQLLGQRRIGTPNWNRRPRQHVALNRDADLIVAVAGSDPEGSRVVKVWETKTGREQAGFRGHAHPITCVAISPDGSHVASAGSEGSENRNPGGPAEGKLWDATTGREVGSFHGHSQAIVGLAFSPDCTQLVSGSNDGTVRVWHVLTGREMLTMSGHTEAVACVAFSPSGRQLVSLGYRDQTVRLWDAQSGRPLRVFSGPLFPMSVAFSPDGRRLAVATADLVKLWDAETGQEAITLRGLVSQRPDDRAFNARVAFSPDGHRIASVNWDYSLNIWNATPLVENGPNWPASHRR